MGSMFLILSLIQVFSGTSIPVFNKLFGYKTGIPVAADYNRVQLWMAMPIMALMAIDTTNMGTGAYASGSLGAFMVYNRGLTADEVTTNFNTLRSRYGI
jgi:cytochrome c biogenesis factor